MLHKMIHKYMLKRTIFRNRMHFLLHGKIRFSDKVTNKEQRQKCIPIF